MLEPACKTIEQMLQRKQGYQELRKSRRLRGPANYNMHLFHKAAFRALYGAGMTHIWKDLEGNEKEHLQCAIGVLTVKTVSIGSDAEEMARLGF